MRCAPVHVCDGQLPKHHRLLVLDCDLRRDYLEPSGTRSHRRSLTRGGTLLSASSRSVVDGRTQRAEVAFIVIAFESRTVSWSKRIVPGASPAQMPPRWKGVEPIHRMRRSMVSTPLFKPRYRHSCAAARSPRASTTHDRTWSGRGLRRRSATAQARHARCATDHPCRKVRAGCRTRLLHHPATRAHGHSMR